MPGRVSYSPRPHEGGNTLKGCGAPRFLTWVVWDNLTRLPIACPAACPPDTGRAWGRLTPQLAVTTLAGLASRKIAGRWPPPDGVLPIFFADAIRHSFGTEAGFPEKGRRALNRRGCCATAAEFHAT
jgi:hypothetical protein